MDFHRQRTEPCRLFDLCVESISRNLHLFDCLENLPEFIAKRITGKFASYFKAKLGKLSDESLPGYIELLRTATQEEPYVLHTLNLPWCARISDLGIAAICSNGCLGSSIINLNLGFCSAVTCDGIIPLAKVCPRLRSIDLTFTKCGDRGIKALAQYCRGIERISLEQCKMVTDEGIQALARGFKRGKLSHLNLGGLEKVSNVGIQILASHLKSLRMLSLSGCNVLDFDLEDVCKSLTLLEDLRLRCCWRLTDASIRQIARMAKRQNGGSHIGQKRNRDQRFLAGTGSCGAERGGFGFALRRLDLGGCKRITSRGVACIAKTCVKLEHLDLRGVDQLDDAALAACSHLQFLKSLNITGCSSVSEEGYAFFQDQKTSSVCTVVGWQGACESKEGGEARK